MSVCPILVVDRDQQGELPPDAETVEQESALLWVQCHLSGRVTGSVRLTGSLVVVDVDPVQLEGRVAHVAPRRVDAVLVADHLPELPKSCHRT